MITRTAIAAGLLSFPVIALTACSSPQQASSESGVQKAPASQAPSAGSLTAQLKTADGKDVATAIFDFTGGYVTVTIKTVANGILAPGLHPVHVHEVGKCEPNSVAPTGGAPGNFLSAGGHFQAPGHTGKPESGDLSSLEVRKDGAGYLVTTTDAFNREELLAGNKTAIMLHGAEGGDMDMPGMAAERVACGVIGPAS